MPEPLISIVICTYNRADLVWGAVASACSQDAGAADYEVLVVDNNSSDHTGETLAGLQRRFGHLRLCREGRQGLSHARNRGWQEARGRYVAYLDDDALIPGGWLGAALAVIKNRQPAVFGGPYYPFYFSPQPAWFKNSYGSMTLGTEPRGLKAGEYLSGGNMVWQRSLLEDLGGFDPDLGVKGEVAGVGEETQLQAMLRGQDPGAEIFYDPELYLFHLVRPGRMRLGRVLAERFEQGGHAPAALGGGVPDRSGLAWAVAWCRQVATLAWHLSLGLLFRDRRLYPHRQNYLYERLGGSLWELGRLSKLAGKGQKAA